MAEYKKTSKTLSPKPGAMVQGTLPFDTSEEKLLEEFFLEFPAYIENAVAEAVAELDLSKDQVRELSSKLSDVVKEELDSFTKMRISQVMLRSHRLDAYKDHNERVSDRFGKKYAYPETLSNYGEPSYYHSTATVGDKGV